MNRLLGSWLTPLVMTIAASIIFAVADDLRNLGTQVLGDKFTCEGRVAGFYADVSSGCQMYHMCDEAGRVFTHACPERTLFQQRTMVCDHWYMVECNGSDPTLKPSSLPRQASGQGLVQVVPLGGFPGRKRHSQRVVASFPYQRGNYSSSDTTPIKSSDKLESFKISSFPSSTQRIPLSNTATIERVERPSFFPITHNPNQHETGEREFPKLNEFTPVVSRAKIERVFKEPALSSSGNGVISQVQFTSSFREPKAEIQYFSTTSRPTTEVSPSVVENKYNKNPYFESYFRSSFTFSPASSTFPTTTTETTTQSTTRSEEEEDNAENRVEIVIPDPRKMFYIPDSNYDPGDVSKGDTVLVIELPGKQSSNQKIDETEAKNHDCPHCHPSFLIPGLCRPCVLIE